MTRRTKRSLVVVASLMCAALVLCCAGVVYFLYVDLSSQEHEVWLFQRREIIDGACDWARAAPLPEAAHVVSVTKGGSIFTRGVRVTFIASAAEIADWLQRSPGPREAVATVPSPGVRHFQLKPGGGAAFAEITVDDTQHRVVIHGYWS